MDDNKSEYNGVGKSLDEIVKHILNTRADVSREEVLKFRKKFEELDQDKDLVLNFREICMMFEDLGMTKTHTEVRHMMKDIDKNNDGAVDFYEFFLSICPPPVVEKPKGPELSEHVLKSGLGGRAQFFEQQIVSQNKNDQEIDDLKKKLALERKRREEEQAEKAALQQKQEEEVRKRAENLSKIKSKWEQ